MSIRSVSIAAIILYATFATHSVSAAEATVPQGGGSCAGISLKTIVWNVSAWPSPVFIQNQRLSYVGRCDVLVVKEAEGIVEAHLADISLADEVKCKYEIVGLSELRETALNPASLYQEAAAKVAASCRDAAGRSRDAELSKSWEWLAKNLTR